MNLLRNKAIHSCNSNFEQSRRLDMLTMPLAVLNALTPAPLVQALDMEVDKDRRLIVNPKARPRYTLDELLAQAFGDYPLPPDKHEWIDAP